LVPNGLFLSTYETKIERSSDFDGQVEDWTWPCVDASDGRVLLNYEIPMDLAVGDIPADLVVGEDVSLLDALDALLNDDQVTRGTTDDSFLLFGREIAS